MRVARHWICIPIRSSRLLGFAVLASVFRMAAPPVMTLELDSDVTCWGRLAGARVQFPHAVEPVQTWRSMWRAMAWRGMPVRMRIIWCGSMQRGRHTARCILCRGGSIVSAWGFGINWTLYCHVTASVALYIVVVSMIDLRVAHVAQVAVFFACDSCCSCVCAVARCSSAP